MKESKGIQKFSLFKLTWPIFVELILQMLVGNVDQIMVSKYSPNAVGALSNANQIINVLILTFGIISMATTILVAQYLGSQSYGKVSEIYTLAFGVNSVFSLVVGAFILLMNKQVFLWMKVPDELMADSQAYIGIIGSFLFLQAIFMTFSAIFRSNALMKEGMFVSIIINVLNIGGNFVLINGLGFIPAMGVAGAAISSNISKGVGVVVMIFLFRSRIPHPISLKALKPFPAATLKRLLAIGLPTGGESLSYNASQICIMKFVNSFGTAVINVRVYAAMFALLSYLYGSAVSQSSQIIVGYLVGAQNFEGADKQVRRTLVSSVLVSLVISVSMYLASDFLFGIFLDDPASLQLGKTILLVDIFLEVGRAVNMVMVRCLQATNDIIAPVGVGIFSMWVVAVGLSYYLGVYLGMGLVGIWIAMAADEGLRAIIFLVRWRSGVWKKIYLRKMDAVPKEELVIL